MLFIPGKITIFSSPSLLLLFFFTISFIFYELTKPANLFLGVYSIFLSLSFSLSLSLSLFLSSFLLRVFHRSERTDTKDSNTIIFNWMDNGAISVLSDINPDAKPT